MVKMTGICRTGVAALALLAAVCSSAADADRIYLRWTADTNALKQASYGNVRILAEKGGAQRYLDLVCDSGSPATNALPVARVIDAVAAGAVLQAVIGDVPPIGTAENYALVLTDASWHPVAAAEPTKYESLPADAISVQTEFGLVTPAQVDWVAGYPKPLERGFLVNGEDIASGSGTGWTYDGSVLSLTTAMTYVLSGAATNNEVGIVVDASEARVVLSNAVVFASGRPALQVNKIRELQMSGGSSFLGTTNNAAAVSDELGRTITVDLAPGADEAEAMIGVFNYGETAAIGGTGEVKVNGGTLAVWADARASAVPLTRAANVFCMLAGSNPETARVVDKYNGEAYVFVTASAVPVTPGTPVGPFTTSESATNAMRKAVLAPRDDVEAALGSGAARQTYYDMFGFAVTGGGEFWFVEAVLYPEAWTNVVLSAQAATRQIPVADIAALPLNTPTNVTVKACCVPGFFYSVYAGSTVTNLGAVAAEKGRNVLCGTDKDVEFSGVVKPSDAAGFFTIGVKEAPSVTLSDRAELDPPAITDVKTAGD